jgi:transglutaminase-like putative cysteine protease
MRTAVPRGPLRFSVVHRTEYDYSAPMTDGYTVAHLLPRETPFQRVESAVIETDPDVDEDARQVDAFGNTVVRVGVHRPHERFVVTSRSVVEALPPPSTDELAASTVTWEQAAAAVRDVRGDAALEVAPYAAVTARTPTGGSVRGFADETFVPGRRLVDAVDELCSRIYREFEFDSGFSDISTPVDAVIDARRGVCQDFAHLSIATLRAVGLAARYVSGYIETGRPAGEEQLTGADVSHAWCSVWSPDLGWLDLDPTNDQFPPTRHVTVGWGRDYFDVAPVRGVVIGPSAEQTLSVAVDVRRLP